MTSDVKITEIQTEIFSSSSSGMSVKVQGDFLLELLHVQNFQKACLLTSTLRSRSEVTLRSRSLKFKLKDF